MMKLMSLFAIRDHILCLEMAASNDDPLSEVLEDIEQLKANISKFEAKISLLEATQERTVDQRSDLQDWRDRVRTYERDLKDARAKKSKICSSSAQGEPCSILLCNICLNCCHSRSGHFFTRLLLLFTFRGLRF